MIISKLKSSLILLAVLFTAGCASTSTKKHLLHLLHLPSTGQPVQQKAVSLWGFQLPPTVGLREVLP